MTDIKSCDLLLLSLTKYYSKNNKISILKDIINSNSPLSLRLIDWYVTNYCKQHNIVYILKKKNENEYFNVYMNYRSQLKAFKKVLFDPFRRRDRIFFHYDKGEELNTTIGQLNFFRWAIDNDVIKYLEQNIINVEKDMLLRQKTIKNDISKKHFQKNTKNSIKNMTTFNGNTLISFK
jgi:hypothetical protein